MSNKISNYVPTEQHMLQILLYLFNSNKSATEAHCILLEAYSNYALDIRICEKYFARFSSGNFEIEEHAQPKQSNKFEYKELQTLLDEDACQTQAELAKSCGISLSNILRNLKLLGFIQKQGNWLPLVLEPRVVECRLFICEQLLQRQKRKGFLHRIVAGGRKWIYYDNSICKTICNKRNQATPSTSKHSINNFKVMLCIWWDQWGVVYYELLKPVQTKTKDCYRRQLIRLSQALRDKRPSYEQRHDEVILHDNVPAQVAKSVQTHLEALCWDVLLQPPYSADIDPTNYHLFRSMRVSLAEQHFRSIEDVKNWLVLWITSKDNNFFQRGIRMLPDRWQTVIAFDGQYFE